jgi:hypothetical protein
MKSMMKITLNNKLIDLPASVIIEQIQPKLDQALVKYKELPVQKRLMLKAGIRTAQAYVEMVSGVRIDMPESDDYVIMLLENLPTWITKFMEHVEIDATTISDLTTRHQTVNGASIKLTH